MCRPRGRCWGDSAVRSAVGSPIYDNETFGTSLQTSNFKDERSHRRIRAGSSVTMLLEFDSTASRNLDNYDLGIDFGSGMIMLL